MSSQQSLRGTRMRQVNIQEIKTQLSRLIASGEG